uniref:Ig-like domain-containing protein n=1 Tax=Lates calcarifer TaxID=8187 RepID=A0A4W6BYA7_LATCA
MDSFYNLNGDLFKITVFNVFFFTDANCADKPVFNPSRLVVKYGDPTSATCSVCQSCQGYFFSLESVGNHTRNGTTALWKVDRMTEWVISANCYYTNAADELCCSQLPVTVYKPPDNVSFSFRDHSGPLLEGHQYTLQCEVHNVAPVENLTVTFYRGQTALGQLQSNNTEKKPVTEIFTLNINTSKEDDGVQYWCEAKLELGPEGPQPPLVVTSEKFSSPWTIPSTSSTPIPSFSMCKKFSVKSFEITIMAYLIYTYIILQPPDNVSFSFRNHSGPLLEGHQYTLQCEVHNVAPVENLTVTFYRGKTALGQLQSNNTEKTPVTEIFSLNINTRKEHDRVQYWCEAKLELGPEGPQPPPVATSEKFSATVNSTPASGTTPSTSSTLIPSFSMLHNVAPVENLTVTFYRGQTALGQLQSNNTEKKPVTEIFSLNINTRKEHDGVQYWCEAKLELGPEGPQPPPVVTSEKFSATVNSTPAPGTTPSTSSTPTPSFSMCFMLLSFSLV